jgi:hypothetical protein
MFTSVFPVFPFKVTVPAADGTTKYSSFTGYAHMAAGLCCGLRFAEYVCFLIGF